MNPKCQKKEFSETTVTYAILHIYNLSLAYQVHPSLEKRNISQAWNISFTKFTWAVIWYPRLNRILKIIKTFTFFQPFR